MYELSRNQNVAISVRPATYPKTVPRMEAMTAPQAPNIDRLLDNLWTAGRLVGKAGATPEQWSEIQLTKTQLLEAVLDCVGRQKPYKQGNYSYWVGGRDTRREIRERLKVLMGGQG